MPVSPLRASRVASKVPAPRGGPSNFIERPATWPKTTMGTGWTFWAFWRLLQARLKRQPWPL
jgi:hypothetical protein